MWFSAFILGAVWCAVWDAVPGDDPSANTATVLREVEVASSADGSMQPVVFWTPQNDGEAVPLLVHLHTWSGGVEQASPRDEFLAEAQQRGWAFVHPHFRGPNNTPEACGSALAIQDIRDAVAFMRSHAEIDASRIYLVGTSGGGHMALQMAASDPELWAGVSAWVPISDLAAWHATHTKDGKPGRYALMLEAVCGGPPGKSDAVDAQYRQRSPLFHLSRAVGLPIDLNAGIHDGHRGSVPIDQTLNAFNVLAMANGQEAAVISNEDIAFMVEHGTVADGLTIDGDIERPRKYEVLMRREAGPARVTLFDGGHTHDVLPAVAWLAQQQRPRTEVAGDPLGQ